MSNNPVQPAPIPMPPTPAEMQQAEQRAEAWLQQHEDVPQLLSRKRLLSLGKITALLFLVVTLPLTVFVVSQQGQLAEIRGKAAGFCPVYGPGCAIKEGKKVCSDKMLQGYVPCAEPNKELTGTREQVIDARKDLVITQDQMTKANAGDPAANQEILEAVKKVDAVSTNDQGNLTNQPAQYDPGRGYYTVERNNEVVPAGSAATNTNSGGAPSSSGTTASGSQTGMGTVNIKSPTVGAPQSTFNIDTAKCSPTGGVRTYSECCALGKSQIVQATCLTGGREQFDIVSTCNDALPVGACGTATQTGAVTGCKAGWFFWPKKDGGDDQCHDVSAPPNPGGGTSNCSKSGGCKPPEGGCIKTYTCSALTPQGFCLSGQQDGQANKSYQDQANATCQTIQIDAFTADQCASGILTTTPHSGAIIYYPNPDSPACKGVSPRGDGVSDVPPPPGETPPPPLPSPPPPPPSGGVVCGSLGKDVGAPQLNQVVVFTCTGNFSAVDPVYEFRHRIGSGSYTIIPGTPSADKTRATAQITIDQTGDWQAQCRVCTDASKTSCTTWGQAQ